MNLLKIFLFVLFQSHNFKLAQGFASKLIELCDKPMEVGIIMMGIPTELNTSYHLKLFRHDLSEVADGGNEPVIQLFGGKSSNRSKLLFLLCRNL
jgi:hypothetical protein